MGRGSVWIPIAGTVCVAALGGLQWVACDQADVRERLARFVAEYEADRAAPSLRREAVYGATIEGNAWDHYVAATRELGPHGVPCRPDEYGKRLVLTEEARAQLAPSLAAALRSVRDGVRCTHAQGTVGEAPGNPSLLDALLTDAMCAAFAAGHGRTGAELFVDRCALAIDLAGRWVSPLRLADDWLGAIDTDTRTFLLAALRRVDERWPCFAPPAGALAWRVRSLADLSPMQQSFTQGLAAWRYGFDSYLRELVACDRLVACLPELHPPAQTWPRRQEQIAAFGAAVIDEHSWTAQIPTCVRDAERQQREGLTHLRFLRLAVAFVQRTALPQLEDPLGSGSIDVEIHGDEATFRSKGTDRQGRLSHAVRR